MSQSQPNPAKDLLQIRGCGHERIAALLERSRTFQDPGYRSSALAGHVLVNMFFESSTRTRASFEIAAKRLGGEVVNIGSAGSSVTKGESLIDTTRVIDRMAPSVVVVRHQAAGSAHIVAENTRAAVVNAGDGAHEHPTQALLDARTILDRKGRIEGLRVAIIGDISHSRVARSNVHLLTMFGADVAYSGPSTLLPDGFGELAAGNPGSLSRAASVDAAIEGADVVMMLRIQLERQGEQLFPSIGEYHRGYGLTEARLAKAKPDAIVMHPGPVNRGVEITPEVADGPQSVILDQVANGVAVRMAVLEEVVARFTR